jgi:hypothetical protein
MFRLCSRHQVKLHIIKKNVNCVENMLEFGRSFKLYGYRNVGILGISFCVTF